MNGPLAGRRLLLTRRWPELAERIARLDGQAVEVPVVDVKPPADPAPLDDAVRGLAAYDWIVFTSASAVEALAGRMNALGAAMPAAARLASVGPATSHAIAEAWPARAIAVQPSHAFRAASLVEAFAGPEVAGRRVLLPVSDRALAVAETGLRALGARVDRVVAYRTVATPPADLREQIARGAHAAVFASPSAVEAFSAAAGAAGTAVPAVVIGPTTAEAARAAGMTVWAVAEAADAEGVARALVAAFSTPGSSRRA